MGEKEICHFWIELIEHARTAFVKAGHAVPEVSAAAATKYPEGKDPVSTTCLLSSSLPPSLPPSLSLSLSLSSCRWN